MIASTERHMKLVEFKDIAFERLLILDPSLNRSAVEA